MSARPLLPLVEESPTWGTIQWWRLELRSLDDAPRAQRALALLSPREAWTQEYGGRPTALGCLQNLLYIVALTAPTVGAAWMLRWAFTRDGQMPLEFAGVLTSLALIVIVGSELVYARTQRAVAKATVLRLALAAVLPTALTLVIALGAVATGGYDARSGPSLWWLVPIGLFLLVSIARWIRGGSVRGGPQNPIENLELSIRELDEPTRARIRAARDEAIRALAAASKIDAHMQARALEADLGMLALTVAPEGRSAYYREVDEGREPRKD